MINYNKVLVGGIIYQNPKYYKMKESGVSVLNIGIATRSYYNEKNGVKKEKTDFHNGVLFGEVADKAKHLKKGDAIFIEGRLQTKAWKSKNRERNYRNEIVVMNVYY